MSIEENAQGYIPLLKLLETKMISPKQIVEAISSNPIYIDVFDDGDIKLADEHQTALAISVIEVYQKKLSTQHSISEAKSEFVALVNSKKGEFSDYQQVLSWFGWHNEDAPKFEMEKYENHPFDLPELQSNRLSTEGRVVAKLLTEAGFDVEALRAGDMKEYKRVREMMEGVVDRGPLSTMLDRWRLRKKKPRSSSK